MSFLKKRKKVSIACQNQQIVSIFRAKRGHWKVFSPIFQFHMQRHWIIKRWNDLPRMSQLLKDRAETKVFYA